MPVNDRTQTLLGVLLAAFLGSVGCAMDPVPVPEVTDVSVAGIRSTLRTRTKVQSLSARADLVFDGRGTTGTFQAAINFQAPGRLRITAWKDLLVLGSEPVFDLILGATTYALDVPAHGDQAPVHDRGPLEDFARRQPRFAGLALTREALFLPGVLVERPPGSPGDGPRVEGEDPLLVVGLLPTGAPVSWTVARRTLEVRSGRVESGRDSVRLTYDDPRRTAAVWLPWRVTFEEPGLRILVVVREAEVDVPIDPSIFEPDESPR